MMNRKIDVLFVEPNSQHRVYQGLANSATCVEYPFWSLLLAESCRAVGYGVAILDANAERLTDEDAVKRIREVNPRLVCFITFGSNPNSSTYLMGGAIDLCKKLKNEYPEYKTCFTGNHTSALPMEVLRYNCVDFVLYNEGVYALRDLLATDLVTDLHTVKGIGCKGDGFGKLNGGAKIVPQERLDIDLPGYALDLLPDKNLYRAHIWHANFNENGRNPSGAIYTSLGCQYACQFCMINILNRTSTEEHITAKDSNIMRFFSKEWVLKEIDKMVNMGIKHIRYVDELFLMRPKHYLPLQEEIINRGYNISTWAYSRCDTVVEKYLPLLRKSGIEWLALGIESANHTIRQEISKGTFKDIKVTEVIDTVRKHDINVISNFMVGFENENIKEMEQTLELALSLQTEFFNVYPAMLLPGSPMYYDAKQKGWPIPESYEAFAFHSYECTPTRTKHLTSAEVLSFRDMFWQKCASNTSYLSFVEKKFGLTARQNIENISKIKLKRKLLGD